MSEGTGGPKSGRYIKPMITKKFVVSGDKLQDFYVHLQNEFGKMQNDMDNLFNRLTIITKQF